ncbi:MAG: SCO family protein [Verrucomicrobiaceae bacterium]|nr:MAG: SCO family protein [Verrucomicrobiaceae bacterium]
MKNLLLMCFVAASPLSAEEAAHPVPAADAALPPGSLYVLKSKWTTQDGREVVWSDSTGTPRVVALGYATCKGICPRVIADMQRIEAGIPADSKTRFTFITLDPENDKQAQMKELEGRHHLDAKRWDLLRGSEDDLLEMAVALGIRFDRLPNGVDFAHSYLIAVIGPDGRILQKWIDPKENAEPSVKAILALPAK